MPDAISQSEIEALLAGMTTVEDTGEGAEDAGASRTSSLGLSQARAAAGPVIRPLHKRRRLRAGQKSPVSAPVTYEPYDFRRPDKLSKENLRALQLLHETFSGYLSSSLSGYLRAQVQIEVSSVEQIPYDEYVKSISGSLLNILNVSPLSGQAIFEVESALLFSMLDRLLGGTGAAGRIVRDLTDIEKALSENIMDHALEDLQTAWESINPLSFEVASVESSPQFVQLVSNNDTVILILFTVKMGEWHGALTLCLPYLLIKPILGKLSAQRYFVSASKRPSALYAAQIAERLRTTRVPCIARLGTTPLHVGELLTLEVGQVLPLALAALPDADPTPAQLGTVDLVIGGHAKFRGRTGLRGKKLAVQIDAVLPPPADLISHKDSAS